MNYKDYTIRALMFGLVTAAVVGTLCVDWPNLRPGWWWIYPRCFVIFSGGYVLLDWFNDKFKPKPPPPPPSQ